MRKLIATVALCAFVAGCNATTGTPTTPIPVSAVQKEAVALCGYLPLARVVAAILAKHSANLDSVFAMASAICAAVAPTRTQLAVRSAVPLPRTPPRVAGVIIRGKFVK